MGTGTDTGQDVAALLAMPVAPDRPRHATPMPATRTQFHPQHPTLQMAWDSTSLGHFKTCPRKYYYFMVLARSPRLESAHLTFGLLYHGALERYDHAKSAGATHEEAQRAAVRYAMEASWDEQLNRPWFSDIPEKTRFTLVRTVVWYLEEFAEDPLTTIQLANGKPAVELSFKFELPYSYSGTPFILAGHIDRLVEFGGGVYPLDRKTTKSAFGSRFFDQFTPHNQFSIYTLATQVVYKLPSNGLIVDAAQVGVTFSRFQRRPLPRTPGQHEEFATDLRYWLNLAINYADQNYWPMNEMSCSNYGGCPMREICARPPETRDRLIATITHEKDWNPLVARGDI